MKWVEAIRGTLGLKILISYLVVILVLIVVLVSAAIFVAPGAFFDIQRYGNMQHVG